MSKFKKYYPVLFVFLCLVLSSCVNLEEKIKLNEDGSGTMEIHYWTYNSNITSEEIYGFGFTDYTVNKNYTSENSQPSDIVIEKNDADSTTHVRLNLKFRDINMLPEAKSFSKMTAEWDFDEKEEVMILIYRLLQDSLNALSPGMRDYKIVHEITFPNEVIGTNGAKNGNTVRWENTVADLVQNVDLVTKVKPGTIDEKKEKKCGLFGLELPIIMLLTLTVLRLKSRR
ncbi:MAG: hypothetical protein KDC42_07800 [Ignavibacteriae bacterium]|nr:hypothetical protein [Ignavibacteriota bacterium]